MYRFLLPLFVFFTLASCSVFAPITQAAQFESGNNLNFSQTDKLEDAYVAGGNINISTASLGDLVVAGGTVILNNSVENDLLATGGNVTVNGDIGTTARIAGGTVIINGKVGRDLVIVGGNVIVGSQATINGDLAISGGTAIINGTVNGHITASGGTINLNGTTKGNVDLHAQSVHLQKDTHIGGDLNYTADQEAQVDNGAVVKGTRNYQPTPQPKANPGAVFGGLLYRVLTSLIFTLLLVHFAKRPMQDIFERFQTNTWLVAVSGLGTLLIGIPVLAIITLIALWLGIAGFMLYFLLLISSWFVAELALGWWILRWWYGRNHTPYYLDWRSAIVGVVAFNVLLLVPVLGWLIIFVLWVTIIGALIWQAVSRLHQNTTNSNVAQG
jgi:cytoskeletal protein CcmA (bactofilin family)